MLNNRAVRECSHQDVRHEHGSPAAYQFDNCRCRLCTEAQSIDTRNRAITASRSELIDAEPVKAHISRLSHSGISLRRVAEVTGIPRSVLEDLRAGQVRCRAEHAARILAIAQDPAAHADPGRLFDSTGTRRRLQALVRIGYPPAQLAARLRTSMETLSTLLYNEDKVSARTVRSVRALYDELWGHPQTGPDADGAVALAEARGWVSPLCWDDDQIDRPRARPLGLPTTRRPLNRRTTDIDDIEHLIRSGIPIPEIVSRCGYSSADALVTRLERIKRRDLIALIPGARSLYSETGN